MKKLLCLSLLLIATLVVCQAPAAGPLPADGVQDFVFLGEARPLLVRLHVRIDDRSPQAACDDCLKYLFDYLDVDGDGFLSKEEAERAPTPEQFLGGINARIGGGGGRGQGQGNAVTLDALDTDKDGKVSREELAAYYRKNGFVPFQFQLESGGPDIRALGAAAFLGGRTEPGVEAVNKAIFQLLDTDKDGKLTKEKLVAAPALLLKLDEDEDEMVTPRELVPDPGTNLGQIAMMAMGRTGKTDPMASSATLVPIPTPGTIPADLARRMRERYARSDGSDEKKIRRKDIGLDETTFRQLDTDNDSVLSDRELGEFVKRTPDLELVVHLGKKDGTRIEVVTADGRSPLAGKFQLKEGHGMLDLGRTLAEMRVNTAERADPIGGFLRQQAVAQFKQADTNGDGFVDAKEAGESRAFRNTFKAIDRKGTGKVSEKDLMEYLEHLQELQKRVTASCVTLALSDQSRGLFDLLDTNRDGRLSVREMRQAPRLLEQFDREGKGYITRDDIPKNYRMELRRGPMSNNGDVGRAFVDAYFTPGGPTATRTTGRGPLWFRKMDRNGDGDVSRKEFLFGDELFREIDTDGDGLISVEEAERYDALHRKEK